MTIPPHTEFHFIKIAPDGAVLYGWLLRFDDDGSAASVMGDRITFGDAIPLDAARPRPWEQLLSKLIAAGYVEVEEARRRGLISRTWQVPTPSPKLKLFLF